ncbi:MAG: thiamine phosphate synthase [Actinomycetota bacterium]|nr:thiamine phosphate synthase [Actinomycetota bacterium]
MARSLEGRRLYLCTGDRSDLASFLAACIRGGVDVVQLRDKQLEALPLLRRAETARAVCREFGVPFILNDRPDLALACGADGVHVGQDDAPPWLARRILGADAIVGRSTHGPAELRAAAGEPVDYLSAGPVNPTPTKPGRPGTGLSYLTEAARHATIPWFVTGGVSPATVGGMVDAGARRFVVVRYLTEASDPEGNTRRLGTAIDEATARQAGGPGGLCSRDWNGRPASWVGVRHEPKQQE